MKRDRNQHAGEGKGKRKKNDHGDRVDVVGRNGSRKEAAPGGGKSGTQKSGKDMEMFNPQLSARELKKIQYYENMFKKMERKREEQQNEGENKGKSKNSNSRRTKGDTELSTRGKEEESSAVAHEGAGEVDGEAVVREEKGDDTKKSGLKGTAKGNNQKVGKNAKDAKDAKEAKDAKDAKDAKEAKDVKEAKQKAKKDNPKAHPRETCAYTIDKEKEDDSQSMDGNQRGKNNKYGKVEKAQMRIKEEELRVDKDICTKMREGSQKAVTLKGKKCLENSKRVVSDNEGGGEDDELHNVERKNNPTRGHTYNDQRSASPKHYTYKKNGMAKGGKVDRLKEENRESSVRQKMDEEREHESDHDVNYDNDPEEMTNFKGKRKMYTEREMGKRVLKIKRSFSVRSNINEYFFDTSSIELMSDNDPSGYGKEEQNSENDNEKKPTFSYKRKKLLQLLTRTDGKDNGIIHPLGVTNNASSSNNTEGGNYNLADSEKWLIWKNKEKYKIRFASNNNSKKRNKWHIVRSYHISHSEANENVDMRPNGKENVVDQQMNMIDASNGTDYFTNGVNVPTRKKLFCEKKCHGKIAQGSSTTNMMIHANKTFDVNCCIKKYLDNMRYTNLKKLKKVNRSNLKLYVEGCTNFLNFDKVDSAILSMRKFQEALQRKGGVGGSEEKGSAPL
ncbi:conserved Plasmodium protein, unknown function [Plasmodium knowlesi strain H]|uniref:Uncharacterized protein n=3 Tax=Plasmodium knowlesi TaxID=5850 RepID=A0A5K1UUA6_PLAKH|nr:conserved Plasmodium protein, unknown function [Plasmodium knowlesi strain H]OTN63701.1 Uncharacterized protein PKNOH_S140290300 [Plasmodium knowlesi]CAA9991313.1 conserved Plasmodium protein, unknown function [Plasmodium knowlesi strain H]SBO26423.1 conserved Plasmodium protein, unknown function [Plasmodium knowlesi strain H]SBO28980.1 conserved Plasmodium protein, unknown function [Plasmodium knowlesi strain H]VVS80787.1 conserved Plasmodium protein, unknown function [Plasmodium knowlesi |eukprot:XP_002262592.1 hypothetical protein, conserved in Plasmodium species [Plasmodium knowlesi strain H]